ncbi:hypothetical protein TDB9533_04780 [Thalassocella blandensis]|nr:hypothetical protein TDB9533_04780 [Thalassocella blandensis]
MSIKSKVHILSPDDSQVDALIGKLWSSGGEKNISQNVYVILDGAKSPSILRMVNNSGLEHACLFAGKLSYTLLRAAPHVVKLEIAHPFTRQIIQLGWENNWGIFVTTLSDTTLSAVRNHCRRIAKAISPTGKPLYFRYFDPSVLWEILPVCSVEELQLLFGPFVNVLSGKSKEVEGKIVTYWSNLYRDSQTFQLCEYDPLKKYTMALPSSFPYQRHFQLRKAHLDVFNKKSDLAFFKVIYKSYRRTYRQTAGQEYVVGRQTYNLVNYLWLCYSYGSAFNLKSAYNFMVFFRLCCQFGWKFWEQNEYIWLKQLLESDRPAEVRIAKIERRLSAQLVDRLWS